MKRSRHKIRLLNNNYVSIDDNNNNKFRGPSIYIQRGLGHSYLLAKPSPSSLRLQFAQSTWQELVVAEVLLHVCLDLVLH